MKTTNQAPFSHGMEIEQMRDRMPGGTTDRSGTLSSWHRDGSGPYETTIGPYKNAKSILNRFYQGTRDEHGSWDWHAADGSSGCGSHVHLCLIDGVFESDREVESWTIAYNSVVELAPILAPFFCHDWENGFRSGANYSASRRAIYRWASPQTVRYSPSSIEERILGSRRFSRTTDSVTLNPRQGEKPVTVEVRMNDGHPGVALTGALYLRRVAGRAIEEGFSPKFANRGMLQTAYDTIYHGAMDDGLFTAMARPETYEFTPGRGIPGVDQLRFDSLLDIFKAILRAYPQTPHSWSYRVQRLVTQADDAYSPANNQQALWNLDAPKDQFRWDNGPDVR